MKTKDELLREAALLESKFPNENEESTQQKNVTDTDFEQLFYNWVEKVRIFLYENPYNEDQYNDFKNMMYDVNQTNIKRIKAIINSI